MYPSTQFFYEKTNGEMLDGYLTGEHALDNALVGPGLDLYYKNVSLNTSLQRPVYTAETDHPASARPPGRVGGLQLQPDQVLAPPQVVAPGCPAETPKPMVAWVP